MPAGRNKSVTRPREPDAATRSEIDAMVYAEHQKRDRRNARFWVAALVVGILAFLGTALVDDHPIIKGLLALIAFIGVMGFIAYLSTKRSLRGCYEDFMG